MNATHAPGAHKRVLVVEDSPSERDLAARLLSRETDWDLVFAEHGLDAMAQLEDQEVDLILTDVHMEPMNGLELFKAVKKSYAHIPVVIMTGVGSEELAVQVLEQGAASYVPKVRLRQDLAATASRVLSVASENRAMDDLAGRVIRCATTYELDNDLDQITACVKRLQHEIEPGTGSTRWSDLRSSITFNEMERTRICMAIYEALLNAYYHGNLEVDSNEDHQVFCREVAARRAKSPYCDRQILVQSRLEPDEAVYVIRDEGPGFDSTKTNDPTSVEGMRKSFGRGVHLMKTVMDEVQFNETGNEVTLIKRRS